MTELKGSRAVRNLSTPTKVARYLSKAFERGPNSAPVAIVTAARSTNMVHLTRKADVSRSNLYRLLEGERGDLKLRTALRLINALGMKIEVKVKRKKHG
jgi:probable addiction module antidote protein